MAEVFSQMKDILLSYDTDISFENNDLMLTSGIDYITREFYKLLITELNDWKTNPRIGCSPNEFTGEQNTRELGKRIEDKINNGLKDTAYPCQINTRVVPTSYDTLMIFVDLLIQNGEIISTPFEFDFINGIKKITQIDKKVTLPKSSSKYKINDISNLKRPNKYWTLIKDQSQV